MNAADGKVTAGAGEWLAGAVSGEGPRQAVRWREGHPDPLGPAFGLDTAVHAINADGVIAGTVTGPDQRLHAIRHRGGYERLPETGGHSTALDINTRGDIVGHDGARIVVWTGDHVRPLPLPTGEAPYGNAAIDDDGTVMASAGQVTNGKLQWHTYRWSPDGTRTPLPAGDVHDLHNGQAVGATPGDAPQAVTWRGDAMLGGRAATAMNADAVAGTGIDGTPHIWTKALPEPLPTPPEHHPGEVTALNTHEAGGFAYPDNADGAVPVRWRCH
jgi:uncharacterized membrane protein